MSIFVLLFLTPHVLLFSWTSLRNGITESKIMNSFKDPDSYCQLAFLKPCYNLYSDQYFLTSCLTFSVWHVLLLKHLHIKVEIIIDRHGEFQMKQGFDFQKTCTIGRRLFPQNFILSNYKYLLKAHVASVTMYLIITFTVSAIHDTSTYLLPICLLLSGTSLDLLTSSVWWHSHVPSSGPHHHSSALLIPSTVQPLWHPDNAFQLTFQLGKRMSTFFLS